jgi:ABC-type transport system substrate-binding protein
VAARPFAAAGHRGGTLIAVTSSLPPLDPVHEISEATPALAGVYDGLLGFRKAGGAQGQTLVPDLAVALPRPTDGGTTYTFTLRRGLRYSNGAVVQASDFRRGIQRAISFGDSPDYYDSIVGAPACHRNARRCDLTEGIVINDAVGTVTFHLDRADPDFPYKLALLRAAPAPPGAADHPMDRAPFLPGTGPYMISQYQPNSSLTLVRNPHFRQWSYAAQPAGYPNVIRIEQMADPRAQQSAVAAGRADLVYVTANGTAPLPSGTRPGSTPASSWPPFTCSSTPASLPSAASRHDRPSTTRSTAVGSSDFSTSAPQPRPPRHARSCPPDSPATGPTARTRPTPATASGTAPTWPRPCGLPTSPAPRRYR